MGTQVMKTQGFELLPSCSFKHSADFTAGDEKES